jgi:type VI secretion system protein ImpF
VQGRPRKDRTLAKPPANLLPSVLDRLIDDAPEQLQDPQIRREEQLRLLRASVRRDLEALLNAHCRCISPPAGLVELQDSVIEYGVQDFLAAIGGVAQFRESFRRSLQEAIRRFEPRFVHFTVSLREDGDRLDRTLRFRIDALMHAEPAPEPMSFDSDLDPTSHAFSVKGATYV